MRLVRNGWCCEGPVLEGAVCEGVGRGGKGLVSERAGSGDCQGLK